MKCPWCGADPLYVAYHDKEWGVPQYDERSLFEFLILEGAQAGLSWITILRKRESYRRAFEDFDAAKIAQYGEADSQRLLADAGIVRNRLKIAATIQNARCTLELRAQGGGLSEFLWSFVDGKPIQNQWRSMSEIPARTALSDKMSKELKRRGFKFIGSTICYAHMQATGMVNDHLVTCPRHKVVAQLKDPRTSSARAKSNKT